MGTVAVKLQTLKVLTVLELTNLVVALLTVYSFNRNVITALMYLNEYLIPLLRKNDSPHLDVTGT